MGKSFNQCVKTLIGNHCKQCNGHNGGSEYSEIRQHSYGWEKSLKPLRLRCGKKV